MFKNDKAVLRVPVQKYVIKEKIICALKDYYAVCIGNFFLELGTTYQSHLQGSKSNKEYLTVPRSEI
jgi:hypothetical protein